MADKKMTQLAAPEAAIASYLDELLHTATSTAREEMPVSAPPVLRAAPEAKPAKVIEKPGPPVRAEALAQASEQVIRQVQEPVTQAAEATRADAGNAEPPARPEWSEGPFECLIFTVAGLQLAVPLVLLGAIHRIEEEIRPIPGSPRWYMGIRPDRDRNLRVVDTAEWIMAGRVPPAARENYRFVIRLDDSEWGLACDDVAQSFTLKPDQVRWRTARSKRPWLAGTVIDHMCALIDVRAMAHLLVRAEREQHLDLS
ncbi:chemotaxis protein CheW [Marinobacter halophilus]|uniref:Chemotaxis protein CheW n=1 Tax=Marinobacter halophilus TaxID=1323740 RepID=A0A2T1K9Q1_9GAMM|nr:chemotaxis protein CheW [Marinobacter halophilus]PSF06748.1 chemotaxis protein CheW [Marinobacter halophilus]GGC75222.1 chemotaxis protein CheW [Marinobacter halophilus]